MFLGLQIHPLTHGESGVETDLDVDDYAESAFAEVSKPCGLSLTYSEYVKFSV